MHRKPTTILIATMLLAACSNTSASSTSPSPTVAADTSRTATTSATKRSTTTEPSTTAPSTTRTTPVVAGKSWIAFQTTDGGRYGVELVRPDGSGQHFAFPAAPLGTEEHPDWSPDGSRMVFTIQPGDDTEDIWLGDVATGQVRSLVDCIAPCHWADEPAWSPDGTQVAFQRAIDVGGHLVSTLELLDPATGSTKVLLTAPAKTVYLAPRWAPDGAHLAVEVLQLPEDTFAADPTGDGIGVLDLADPEHRIRMLTDFAHMAQNPDWSWRTDRILYAAYSVDGQSTTDLFTVRPDGSDRRQVTHFSPTGLAREATYTQDGSRILFMWAKDVNAGRLTMATVAADGTDVRSATGDSSLVGQHPRVQPT
jgi:dipeptidyl aminopeptidase/acylaminoacyl peptidase